MVYYYSGTGNSAYAATELSRLTGEKHSPLFIPKILNTGSLEVCPGDLLGFVFPIYSWGVPPIVVDFVKQLPADIFRARYVWAVCTCGDEAGNAMKMFARLVKRVSGKAPDLQMSLIMPNNYVLLPGFNVDPQPVAERKLHQAPERLREIAAAINRKERNVQDVHTGSVPALRSMVYPLFKKWGVDPKKWKAGDLCVSCGLCAQICPVGNVSYDAQGHPVWGDNCLSCCGCFHVCPRRAIDYGNATKGKGQYLFPGSKLFHG